MTTIFGSKLYTGDWEPNPPEYDTAEIDGVKVTGAVLDDGRLFTGSKRNETGAWRMGYEEGSVSVTIQEVDGELRFEIWPYGDETDTNQLEIVIFDGNGNLVAVGTDEGCGWEGGCETYVSFKYDFSGNTKTIEPGDYSDTGSSGSFTTDRIIIGHGFTGSDLDKWPEALDVDEDFSVDVVNGTPSSVCPGSSFEFEAEVTDNTLFGGASGTMLITNKLSGEVTEVELNGDTAVKETISIPSDVSVGNSDVISVEVE